MAEQFETLSERELIAQDMLRDFDRQLEGLRESNLKFAVPRHPEQTLEALAMTFDDMEVKQSLQGITPTPELVQQSLSENEELIVTGLDRDKKEAIEHQGPGDHPANRTIYYPSFSCHCHP